MPREASDLLHGTLDVLVLKTLSWGPMHGYWIVEKMEAPMRRIVRRLDTRTRPEPDAA